jgi:hypothetical protein
MELKAMYQNTILRVSIVALSFASLAACASIDSRPGLVLPRSKALADATAFSYPTANTAWIAAGSDEAKARAIRDRYLDLQMRAIDASYQNYLIELSQEAKAGNLGFDFIALALTAGASVGSKKTANALSSAAIAITGTRDAFNKDVFFERTLPAIFSEMAASRSRARLALIEGKTKSAKDYSLSEADQDLRLYDEAANLNLALQAIAKAAADREEVAKVAEEELKAEFVACTPAKNTLIARAKIAKYLNGLPNDQAGTNKIASIANGLDIKPAGKSREILVDGIFEKISQKFCKLEDLTPLVAQWDSGIL